MRLLGVERQHDRFKEGRGLGAAHGQRREPRFSGSFARTSSGSSCTAERIPPEAPFESEGGGAADRRELRKPCNVSAASRARRARQTVRSETPDRALRPAMGTRSPSAAAPSSRRLRAAPRAQRSSLRDARAPRRSLLQERSGTDLPVQAGVLLGARRVMRSASGSREFQGFYWGYFNGNPYAWCFGSFACKWLRSGSGKLNFRTTGQPWSSRRALRCPTRLHARRDHVKA